MTTETKLFFKALFATSFVLLLCVLFGYFIFWIAQDPFNIIPEEQKTLNTVDVRWNEQKKICEDKGGIPIQSGWDGQIKECRF